MIIKHLTPELVRGMAHTAVPTAEQQDHLEVRLLTLYITYVFINGLVGPITYIFQLSPSLLFRVASLSHAPNLVGFMYIGALMLATPHALALVFFPKTLATRWPRKLATLAAAVVALTWAYLAVLALPLDAGPLFWLYIRQAVEAIGLAALYAISLNSQLLRAIHRMLST